MNSGSTDREAEFSGRQTVVRRHALQTIITTLAQIVADGPASFDSSDVSTVLGSALQTTIGAIKTLPCSKL